eukprot:11175784-Lingulodinium_polyedra.AAC.1
MPHAWPGRGPNGPSRRQHARRATWLARTTPMREGSPRAGEQDGPASANMSVYPDIASTPSILMPSN